MKYAAIAAALLLCRVAVAQETSVCNPEMTSRQCNAAVRAALLNARQQESMGEVEEALAVENTGAGTAGFGVAGGSINDFVPLISAVLGIGGLTQDDSGRIGFDWNNPLGLPDEHRNKVTVTVGGVEIYEPLKTALNDANLQDLATELEDALNEGDDVAIGFSYSTSAFGLGRNPAVYDDLFAALMTRASTANRATNAAVAAARAERARLENAAGIPPFDVDRKLSEFPGDVQAYTRATEAEYRAEYADLISVRDALGELGFYRLVDLINNQSQLNFTATYRMRDEFAGPDEFRAIVSFELGSHNISTFRRFQRSCAKASDRGSVFTSEAEAAAACFGSFLANIDEGVENAPRIAFHAEYVKRNRLDIALPDPAFAYALEPQESFTLSATLGRYLGKETSGRTRARLDLELSYEDVSDDPLRNSRGLANATLTYPVGEGLYLSLGAVYATKPEFRGDVDEELSANAGFTYKIVSDTGKKK
jgi:hypothetical protein